MTDHYVAIPWGKSRLNYYDKISKNIIYGYSFCIELKDFLVEKVKLFSII